MILGASLLSCIPNVCVAVDGGILAFLALWRLSFLYLGYQQIQAAQRKTLQFCFLWHWLPDSTESQAAECHFPNPIAIVLDSTLVCLSGLIQQLWADESDCTLAQTILLENEFLFKSLEPLSCCSAALQTFKSYVLIFAIKWKKQMRIMNHSFKNSLKGDGIPEGIPGGIHRSEGKSRCLSWTKYFHLSSKNFTSEDLGP